MEANRLLPWLGAIVIILGCFVGLRACSRDNAGSHSDGQVKLDAVPKAPTPDADSPADTVRTLTARLAEAKSQIDAVLEQNKELLRQKSAITATVRSEVREDLRREQLDQKGSAFDELAEKLKGLSQRINTVESKPQMALSAGDDVPLGLGLTEGETHAFEPHLVWIEPLGSKNPAVEQVASGSTGLLDDEATDGVQSDIDDSVAPEKTNEKQTANTAKPVYTVPRNATLVGSTGMTALIGRIPFDGAVQDPFPFKVIVGADNLAANGLTIPGLYGMIFSGRSTGDWTLSCVRGEINSATFVFEDGAIQTVSSDDNSLQNDATQGAGQNRALGWLSDKRGIPCISGRRISNAASFLAARFFAKGLEAGAEAISTQETTQAVSPIGGVSTSTITGDAAKFAGFRALAGGFEELSDYIAERMAQSFDVVYVDTGIEVALHIDRELPIDQDTEGRKLAYDQTTHHSRDHDLD